MNQDDMNEEKYKEAYGKEYEKNWTPPKLGDQMNEGEFRKAYENEWSAPKFDDQMILVVAGTLAQASSFAREHGIYPRKWRPISNADQLKGVSGSVVYVGSYYERSNLDEIREMVDIGVQTGTLKVIEYDG